MGMIGHEILNFSEHFGHVQTWDPKFMIIWRHILEHLLELGCSPFEDKPMYAQVAQLEVYLEMENGSIPSIGDAEQGTSSVGQGPINK